MPIHDTDPDYAGVVPFCKNGLCEVEIVGPEEAEIFYMGQFSDDCPDDKICPELFPYWESCPEKHTADIEGDWPFRDPPIWLWASPITINGCDLKYKDLNWFVRPTFSKLFVKIARNYYEPFDLLKTPRGFSFIGLPDQHGCRVRMAQIFSQMSFANNICFTSTWNGPTDPKSAATAKYIENMKQYTFALCPRGNGKDSARFFEACYFGRIPVIVGDNKIPFEDENPRFFERISQNASQVEFAETIEKLYRISDEKLVEMSKNARTYFDKFIRPYIFNSTKSYLEWYASSL